MGTLCMNIEEATENIAKAAVAGVEGGAADAAMKLGRVVVDGAIYEPMNAMVYGGLKKIGKGCPADEYMMQFYGLVGQCMATEKKKHNNLFIGEYEKHHCPEGFHSGNKVTQKAKYGKCECASDCN